MVLCLHPQRDHKQWSRENGWSFPLHPFQLLAWLFLVMFALLYFGVLVPSLPAGCWQIAAYLINGIIFFTHTVIHLVSVSLNPADPNVRAKNYKGPLPRFDRNKHAHVIENQFCYICEVKVGIKSKHCSACNKCVSSFDHHCKWLNNCIGSRNYSLFISCVATALLGCSVILATSAVLIAAYFMKGSWLDLPQALRVVENSTLAISFSTVDTLLPDPVSTTLPLANITFTGTVFSVFIPVTGVLWLVVVILTAALSLLGVALLGHLLCFHICLIAQGLSTYDYIVQKRQESATEDSTATITNSYHQPRTSCWNHCLKQILHRKQANQVSPAKHGSNAIKCDELELQATSSSQQIALPNVATVQNSVDDSTEKSLENCVGNVYLGSPHRRRHYLEPLYLQPSRNPNDFHCSTNPLEKEAIQGCVVTASTTGQTQESDQPLSNNSLSSSSSHGRRRHNSTSPTLPPIMEMDCAASARRLPPLQRSISSQSLHSLRSEDGEHVSEEWDKGLGEKTNSSLSNLLLGVSEDEVFDNGEVDDDDDVREVHFTQSPIKERPSDRPHEHEEVTRHSSQSFPILKTQERTHPLFDSSHRVPRLSRCMSLNEVTYSNPKISNADRGFSASNISTRNVVYLGKVAQTAPSCNIIESSCANSQYGAGQASDVHVYHKGKTYAAVQEITTIPMFDSVVMEYHSTYRQSPVV